MTSRAKPLTGVRVLDLTRLLPGPLCTLHLADMGADVVKIEDPLAGDYARNFGVDDGLSPFFLLLNRNKRGLKLDLKQEAGRDALLRLARDAQVVVESFRPGVMDRLGIGYEAVRKENPAIVYCAISGFGQSGPLRDAAGHDINYCGYAGVLDQIGTAGGPPVVPNFQIADLLGGTLAGAVGILAALLDARASGQGRYVDVAMADTVLTHAIFPMVTHLLTGHTASRGADLISGALPCYNVYRTGDGKYMAVGALEKKFWDALCDVIGRADLKPRHMASGADGQRAKAELAGIFAARTQAQWVAAFAGADCCVTPVLTLEEALDHPQFRARGLVVTENHPAAGPVRQFALPLKFSEFQFSVERPAPAPGEHSTQILAEAGFSAAEIDALRAAGVI